MKMMKTVLAGTAMIMAMATIAPAMAQESSYKSGTVWTASRIDVMPGEFENYMDWLATKWKKIQELGKAEGIVVDYKVLHNERAGSGEADLVLVVEYKDYQTNAQRDAFDKKVNAMMAQDNRTAAKANGERRKMREGKGVTEYQELILK